MASCRHGHPVSPGSEFCDTCGDDVRPACGQGHRSGAGARFCETCGEPLPAAPDGEPAAPVLDYTSGSFADFLLADEPGSFITADEPGTFITADEPGTFIATDEPGTFIAADEPDTGGTGAGGSGAAGTEAGGPDAYGTAAQVAGAGWMSDVNGTATYRNDADDAGAGATGASLAGADRSGDDGRGDDGPGARPMEPARAPGRGAEVGETGGVTGTKPMHLHPHLIIPEPWRDAHPDVLASLPPYMAGKASPPPARSGRARTLTIVLALAVLAGVGAVGAFTLLRHHPSAPQVSAPSSTGASPAATPASPKPTAPALQVRASGWTAPTPIDQTGLEASNAIVTGLSCPGITLCYAVDSAGNVLSSTSPSASTRGTWHVVAKDGNGLVAISCPTAGFCLAVDKAGDAITLSNGSWSSPVYVDARSGVFTAVSCPQTTFCMAADSGGNAFAYTGGSPAWQPFTVDTSGGGLTGVSCTSPSYCVAVDTGGGAYTYDGTSWSTAVAVDVGHAFTAVSCASQSFCAATDDNGNGNGAILAGGQWAVKAMGTTAAALSCPADGSCVATGGSGGAAVYAGGAWSPVTRIDGQRVIDTLSCPARSACTAMDRGDNVLYYAPPPSG